MMSKLVALTIMACLSSVILTQGSTVSKPVCSTTSGQTGYNPFLIWAKNNGGGSSLVMAQAPTTANKGTWSICKTVWSAQKGSCCEVSALKNVYKKVVDRAKQRWKNFLAGVVRMRKASRKLKVLLTNMDASTKSSFKLNQNEDSVGMAPTEALDKMASFVQSFNDSVKTFKNDANNCFKALHPYRGFGICYACSGNGANYAKDITSSTYSGFSLVVKPGTCSNIISKCHSTWYFMLKIQQAAYISAIISKIRKGSVTPQKPKIGGRRTLEDAFSTLKACKSTTSSDCTNIVKDKLCESFFSFIDGEATAKDNNIDNVPEKSGSNTNGRRLQGSTSSKTDISGFLSTEDTGIDLKQVNNELTSSSTVSMSTLDQNQKVSALLKASLMVFLLTLGLYL